MTMKSTMGPLRNKGHNLAWPLAPSFVRSLPIAVDLRLNYALLDVKIPAVFGDTYFVTNPKNNPAESLISLTTPSPLEHWTTGVPEAEGSVRGKGTGKGTAIVESPPPWLVSW